MQVDMIQYAKVQTCTLRTDSASFYLLHGEEVEGG